jgi:hypothetical protein
VNTALNTELPLAFLYRHVDTDFGRMTQTWSQYQQQARSDIFDDS